MWRGVQPRCRMRFKACSKQRAWTTSCAVRNLINSWQKHRKTCKDLLQRRIENTLRLLGEEIGEVLWMHSLLNDTLIRICLTCIKPKTRSTVSLRLCMGVSHVFLMFFLMFFSCFLNLILNHFRRHFTGFGGEAMWSNVKPRWLASSDPRACDPRWPTSCSMLRMRPVLLGKSLEITGPEIQQSHHVTSASYAKCGTWDSWNKHWSKEQLIFHTICRKPPDHSSQNSCKSGQVINYFFRVSWI